MGSKLHTVLKLVFLHTAFQACTAGLPGNCIYYKGGNDSSTVRCKLQQVEDYANLRRLPLDITNLKCLVSEPFLEEHFSIQRLEKLKSLVLQPQKQRTDGILSKSPGTLGIKNDVIFQGPHNLTNLGIHLSLIDVNTFVFRVLVSLRVLDLSNTEGISSALLRTLLHTIDEVRPPLVKLNLTRINVRGILTRAFYDPIRLKRAIYEPLKHITTLKTLDVRNNGFVGLQGGLTQFLPQLEEIYLGENVFTFYEDSNLCTLIDGVIHPSLKNIFLSFVPKATLRVRKSALEDRSLYQVLMMEIKRCTFPGRSICGMINCMCSSYFTVPYCSGLSEDRFRQMIAPPRELSCKSDIQLPMPPNLERLTTRSLLDSEVQHMGDPSWRENFCFLPDNKLAYADLSSSHLDFYLGNTRTGVVGMKNLISITLEFNQIDLLLIAKVFKGRRLKRLFLTGNFISGNYSSSESLFREAPNLEVLDLSRCQLSHVPELNYLTKLTKVDLSQNMLTAFPVELTAITLHELNLSQNVLPLLPEQSRRRLDAAAEHGGLLLDLTDNRILCQCHTDDFISWMQATDVQFAGRSTMLCTYTNGVMMAPWDVNVDELRKECSNFYTIVYSVIGCLISVIISIAVVLLYIKRWAIRFWLHNALETWRKRRGQIAMAQENRYRFDVFVAYSSRESREREWVHLTLVPKLENEHGMKACIHHRDFMPGRDICDNIVDSMNASRKILLILSPNFINSDWCNFEVRMARVKLVEERRDSIVLLLYKPLDVPGGKIPKKLTRLLEKKTYAEWTNDAVGQRLFWSKLVQALSDDMPHRDPYGGLNDAAV